MPRDEVSSLRWAQPSRSDAQIDPYTSTAVKRGCPGEVARVGEDVQGRRVYDPLGAPCHGPPPMSPPQPRLRCDEDPHEFTLADPRDAAGDGGRHLGVAPPRAVATARGARYSRETGSGRTAASGSTNVRGVGRVGYRQRAASVPRPPPCPRLAWEKESTRGPRTGPGRGAPTQSEGWIVRPSGSTTASPCTSRP